MIGQCHCVNPNDFLDRLGGATEGSLVPVRTRPPQHLLQSGLATLPEICLEPAGDLIGRRARPTVATQFTKGVRMIFGNWAV